MRDIFRISKIVSNISNLILTKIRLTKLRPIVLIVLNSIITRYRSAYFSW